MGEQIAAGGDSPESAVTVLKGRLVATPGGWIERGRITVDENGLIAAVSRARDPIPEWILVPGFVDLQMNGCGNVDVATAGGDAWERLDMTLLGQGVTTWCPTLTSAPFDALSQALGRIERAAARHGGGRPCIAGAHLEGPFLGGAPGAHGREFLRPIDMEWIEELGGIVRIVTLAPELDGAIAAIQSLASRGVLVALGHSTATYKRSSEAVSAGARLVTHLFNAMAPMHHREPGLVGAALSDDRLAVSLIADLEHVHPAVLRAVFQAKGSDRVVLVTDSVAASTDETGEALAGRLGATPAPRLPGGTLAGSSLTMPQALRNAVAKVGVPLEAALKAMTATPAHLLGLVDRGRLAAGQRCDVVALSEQLEVEATWVGGCLVWERRAASSPR